MPEGIRTIADLLKSEITPKTPRESLRFRIEDELKLGRERGEDRLESIQRLFPTTILDDDILLSFTAALLSGNHVLLFGPPGSGKTNLAKDIWNLLPKEVWVVADCPVQDDPFSLVDSGFSSKISPCPFCKSKYGQMDGDADSSDFSVDRVDPSKVPVKKVTLREGFGLSRVQGSPEVFPDNLTGTINLHKLEDIGDPTNPLVLQPGKLLQANRGLLLIDEISKLPLGTQSVLLQCLQEGTVSPAKSRETYPASFLAIATSNLDDLDNLTEPLNDRLTNIHVGFSMDHEKNMSIIRLAMSDGKRGVFIPEIFKEASAHFIESWREVSGKIYEFAEVGSNRTMIDIVTRSESYAVVSGKRSVGVAHFRRGVRDAMLGRIRARGEESFLQNSRAIESFVDEQLELQLKRAGENYWCRFFRESLGSDRSKGERALSALDSSVRDPRVIKTLIQDRKSPAGRFTRYILDREGPNCPVADTTVISTVFSNLSSLKVFQCPDEP